MNTVAPQPTAAATTDEVALKDFVGDFSKRKKALIIVSLICGVLGGLLGSGEKTYQASVTVTPAFDDAGGGRLGGLGGLVSQYSGLAALAGVSLGSGGRKESALATLKSQQLTAAYIKDENLLPVLYQTPPGQKKPTIWMATRFFDKTVRRVVDDPKNGVIVISMTWRDPKLAAKWANGIVARTNEFLRTKAIQEAEQNIAYLNEQATKTDLVEVRRAINGLLEQEINKVMLARGRSEYALKVVDPAVAPEVPSNLGPVATTIIGIFLGFMGTIFWILVRRILTM